MKLDPYFRKNAHHMMTFSMEYAYSENYILVLSHDEVVHLKCSMLNKMPGEGWDKFRNLKAAYAFMMGHPGKKLLFMGQEFAQLREWSEERELDWFLLAEEPHQQIQTGIKICFIFIRRIRHCMSWIMIRRDLTGSIRMISSGVFSVSQDIQRWEEESAFCMQLYTGRQTGLPCWCSEKKAV